MKEKLIIAENTLYKLLTNQFMNPIIDGYKIVEDTITGADKEDGGSDHDYVIQRIEDLKYFFGTYTAWDIDNIDYDEKEDKIIGEGSDLNTELIEVFPKEKRIVVYE